MNKILGHPGVGELSTFRRDIFTFGHLIQYRAYFVFANSRSILYYIGNHT